MEIKSSVQIFIDDLRQFDAAVDTRTATGTAYDKRVVTAPIDPSEKTHSISDLGNVREMFIRNDDATNFVTFGTASGTRPFRVYPGSTVKVDLDPTTNTIYLSADTAQVEVTLLAIEA